MSVSLLLLPCVSQVSKSAFLNHWGELEVEILVRGGQIRATCPFSALVSFLLIPDNLDTPEQFLGAGFTGNRPASSACRRSWAAVTPETLGPSKIGETVQCGRKGDQRCSQTKHFVPSGSPSVS